MPTPSTEPQAAPLVFVGFSRTYTAEENKAGCPEILRPEYDHYEWLHMEMSCMFDSLREAFGFDKVQEWIARERRDRWWTECDI